MPKAAQQARAEQARAEQPHVHAEAKEPPRAAPEPEYTDYTEMPKSASGWENVRAQLRQAGLSLPSTTRWLVTLAVTALCIAASVYVGSAIIGFFVAGAMSMTTSAFLVWVAWFIGACIATYVGAKFTVGMARYFLSGNVDNDLARARNSVAWTFTADPKPGLHRA